MAERGIILSGPEVLAVLAGTKTQKRFAISEKSRIGYPHHEIQFGCDEYFTTTGKQSFGWKCPFGQPGDHLFGKETWMWPGEEEVIYRADPEAEAFVARYQDLGLKWRSPACMPRRFSRIGLEISEVRVQRLQEITEEDARAEGIIDGGCLNCGNPEPCGCANLNPDARDGFVNLWHAANAARGDDWSSNPWAWAVSFRRVNA